VTNAPVRYEKHAESILLLTEPFLLRGASMDALWKFISRRSNRERMAWLGTGAVVIIGGLWAAFIFFFDHKSVVKSGDCSVTAERDATRNTLNCNIQPAPPPAKP
jgi:hypothetical protein